MVDDDRTKLARLHAVLEALLETKLSDALGQVEAHLARWRAGELRPFDVHTELIEHTGRVGRMAKRIARANPDMLRYILRDAYDLGVIQRDEFIELVDDQPEAIGMSLCIDDDAAWDSHKRLQLEALLGTGPVLIHLDTRVDGVAVPSQFRGKNRLVLRFGYDLAPPIVDLRIDELGIRGTLTFNKQPFGCVVPWAALYAAVAEADGHSVLWAEDTPDEILVEVGSMSSPAAPAPDSPAPEKPKKTRASHLKLVD